MSYFQHARTLTMLTSGVFRISVRRGQGAVGVKGSGVGWRELGPSREKQSFICNENDKFGCILLQFFKGRKYGQSIEALGYGFCGLVAKKLTTIRYDTILCI